MLDHESRRTRRDRRAREVVTVHACSGHAEEQRGVADAARVIGEVRDLDGPSPDHVTRRERADQRVQLHQRDSSDAYCVADVEAFSSGASGGTSRYCSENRARSRKIGAATTPPPIWPCGSSTITRIARRGLRAGTSPTNDATYFETYLPFSTLFAVPVFPATVYPGIAASVPVPSTT